MFLSCGIVSTHGRIGQCTGRSREKWTNRACNGTKCPAVALSLMEMKLCNMVQVQFCGVGMRVIWISSNPRTPKSASDDSFEDGIGFPVKHMWENVYARTQYCSDKISQLPIWNMSPSWTEFAAQQERPEDVCTEIYGAGQNLSGENMNTDGKVSLGTLHCSDVRKFETSTMLDGAFHSIVCDTASGSGEFASNNWKAS